MRPVTTISILVVALQMSAASSCAQSSPGQNNSATNTLERNVDFGPAVLMELEAGDHEIKAGEEKKIRIRWQARTPEKLAEAKVSAEVQGHDAKIKIRRPGGSNIDFKVVIELPSRADVFVRLSGGDLRMSGIEGSKDVELHAGDLDMDIGDPASYGPIDASIKAGDLNLEAFHVSKSGLFRHFHMQGKGGYRLHVHVGAGDLRLHGSGNVSHLNGARMIRWRSARQVQSERAGNEAAFGTVAEKIPGLTCFGETMDTLEPYLTLRSRLMSPWTRRAS